MFLSRYLRLVLFFIKLRCEIHKRKWNQPLENSELSPDGQVVWLAAYRLQPCAQILVTNALSFNNIVPVNDRQIRLGRYPFLRYEACVPQFIKSRAKKSQNLKKEKKIRPFNMFMMCMMLWFPRLRHSRERRKCELCCSPGMTSSWAQG